MSWWLTVLLGVLAFVGCQRPTTPQEREQSFLDRAGSAGMLQARLADVALSHCVRREIYDHARHVLEDWTDARKALTRAARADDLELPSDLSEPHQEEYIRVAAARGPEFDQAYLLAAIEADAAAVADFREEKTSFRSETAKWAAAELPELERRLAAARRLAAQEESPAVRISAATSE
ncbi:MAG TPA: DUF4142 domain-containing protein [Myxococcota bacterium]|nr:DUF4142 domain-containing protein [Myxococcota bacterium]